MLNWLLLSHFFKKACKTIPDSVPIHTYIHTFKKNTTCLKKGHTATAAMVESEDLEVRQSEVHTTATVKEPQRQASLQHLPKPPQKQPKSSVHPGSTP